MAFMRGAGELGRCVLNGHDHILVAQHNEVLHERLACIGRKGTIALEQKRR
jgi:hypothetical protein